MSPTPIPRNSLPPAALSFLVEGEVVYNSAAIDNKLTAHSSNSLWLIVTDRRVAFNAPVKSTNGGYSIEKGSIPIQNITGSSRTEASINEGGCCGCNTSTRKVFHLRLIMAGSETILAMADSREVDSIVNTISSFIRKDQSS